MKHTTSPWSEIPQSDGSVMIAHVYETDNQMKPKGLRLIAHVLVRRDTLAENEANASLIAACPAMYEYIATKAADGDLEAQTIMESIRA